VVNHLTKKTTTSFKTSLAANATYNLVKPDLLPLHHQGPSRPAQ
jgi:hypothetical protein